MRELRILFVLLVAFVLVSADSTATKGPILRLSKRTIDFGRIDQHMQVHEDIMLRNEGDAPLRILEINSDCGCSAAMPSDSIIMPGASTKLAISFSSRNYKGDQKKTITLHTTDPAEPKAKIKILANVHPVVRLDRERVRFPDIGMGQKATERVRLAADKGKGLKIVDIKGTLDVLTWSAKPDHNSSEDAFIIALSTSPDAPPGHFKIPLRLEIEGPPAGKLQVTAIGQVVSYFSVSQRGRVQLPVTPRGTATEGTITITCDGSKPYRLLGVESPVPHLTCEIIPNGENEYTLKVKLSADAPPGLAKDTLEITTSDPDQPTIEIAVQSRVRSR